MSELSRFRSRILEHMDKHILYSSNFEHYCKLLLGFLCKTIGAKTVFLAYSNIPMEIERHPIVYGANVSPAIQRGIANIIKAHAVSGREKGIICQKISSHGSPLGWAGAVLSPDAPPTRTIRAKFGIVCKSLQKDFCFIREQMLQNQRLARLDTLYEVSQAVSETLNLDKLLNSITEAAKNLVRAQAASLAVVDPINQELIFTVTKGPHEKVVRQQRLKYGQGIVGAVIDSGKPLLIRDAQKDARFYRGIDKITGFTTHSILCVPMKVHSNMIGALEVLNPADRGVFKPDQIPLLSTLAQEAAVSIENARLFQLATTDGLTGLATIRYFKTLLEYEMARATRYQRPLSLVLIDIDFFKKVNDTYGHLAGDLTLRELAKIIRSSIRLVDIPARYGGEEFIVMLPEAPQRQAVAVAERLRKMIQSAKFSANGHSYSITVSCGIATMVHSDRMDQFVQRADQKLYEAKKNGRNRVEK